MKKFIILLMALTLSATMIFAAATEQTDTIQLTSTIPALTDPAIQFRAGTAKGTASDPLAAVTELDMDTVATDGKNAAQEGGTAFFDIYQSATTNFLNDKASFTMTITPGEWTGTAHTNSTKATTIEKLVPNPAASLSGVLVSETTAESVLTLDYNNTAIQYAAILATFEVTWGSGDLIADTYTSDITITYTIPD